MSQDFINDQADLLEFVADSLNTAQMSFVTGSQASAIYGEPRFTQDIDIVLELITEQIPSFLQLFASEDFYLSEAAVRNAVTRRGMFNLIQPSSGSKVDFVVAKNSNFDRTRMTRTRLFSISEKSKARFASPEDVILKKMQWFSKDNSDRHIRDILGVLQVQQTQIDVSYVETWLDELGVRDVWTAILERQGRPNPTYE